MLAQHRVLIVEDQPFAREALHLLVAEMGCPSIMQAENGHNALLLLRSLLPSVILCDVNMKPNGGLAWLQALRSGHQNYFNIPVIFLSDNTDAEVVRKAAALGVDGYLVKPANAERLMAAIDKALKKHLIRQETHQLRVLVVDADSTSQATIKTILNKQRIGQVHQAADGDQAQQIIRSLLPTFALCDIGMNVMDGFTFLAELWSNAGGQFHFPVIYQTNHNEPAAVQKAAALKVDGYLLKPVTHPKLVDKLRDLNLI